MAESTLSWSRLLTPERLGAGRPRREGDARSEFQRDFDRIVFSSAFRRLQDKTQVFPLARNDYVRTRLTHSLEVSSVGRSLGNLAGDTIIGRHRLEGLAAADVGTVVASACLAHDIGNPPFGHAGEDAIRLWFRDSDLGRRLLDGLQPPERADLLNYEGNAQGFRLLTRLQSPDNPGGMQLTCAALGTFTKYPRGSVSGSDLQGCAYRKFGYFHEDHDTFARVAGVLELPPQGEGAWVRHPLAYLVEAADDICYLIIDIEDGFRSGLLSYDEVLDLLAPLAGAVDERLGTMTRPKERVEYLRARAIGELVRQTREVFLDQEPVLLAGGPSQPMLSLIPLAVQLQTLKTVAEERVYVSQPVVEVGAAGFEVMWQMLDAFAAAVEDVAGNGPQASARSRMLLRLVPEQFIGAALEPLPERYRRILRIADFISGMTDTYAVKLFKQITGISLGG